MTSQARLGASIGEFAINGWKDAGLLKPSVVKPVLATCLSLREPTIETETDASIVSIVGFVA